MFCSVKKYSWLVLLLLILPVLNSCIIPVEVENNDLELLQFSQPLPEDDTVMVGKLYKVSIGELEKSPESNVRLIFVQAPEGYKYDDAEDMFIWEADLNKFTANSGPFTIKAALTNGIDTIYHEWTLYLTKHEWELMSWDNRTVEIAAYDSNFIIKLNDVLDSSINGYNYYSASFHRSYSGGRDWETYPIYEREMLRFLKCDIYGYQAFQDIRVHQNSLYFIFFNARGYTGPPIKDWTLYKMDICTDSVAKAKTCFLTDANALYGYCVSYNEGKEYQLTTLADPNGPEAKATIFCGDKKELVVDQNYGYAITCAYRAENIWASFYLDGLYRKIGTNGIWENVSPHYFKKLITADDNGDTLYAIDFDSTLYYAIDVNTESSLELNQITKAEKVIDVKMLNGRTGWILTEAGKLYFTNDMFENISEAVFRTSNTQIVVDLIIKSYKDECVFVLGQNGELFRY